MSDLNEQEKTLLMNHDYDGIQEFDYPLPMWWVVIFWGCIAYSTGYFIFYHVTVSGPNLKEEWVAETKQVLALNEKYIESLGNFDSAKYAQFSSPDMVNYGGAVYDQNCLQCHAEKGAGDIGPNLTDKHWLFAEGTAETIYPFIIQGNPSNGMPAWGGALSEDDLYAVTAYIMSVQGIEHANPKAPQGVIPGEDSEE